MSLSPGTRLGPYEILGPLGAGGMGEVFRARDTRLGREVAIKMLPEAVARDPERLARFEREAQAVAALSHPNLLAIHDFGATSEGAPYAVTELLEGETLLARLAAGALPVRRASEIGVAIAHGLAAAHDKGIVHRDLKPENVWLCPDGRVKILDFGLAKVVAPTAPADSSVAPTVAAATAAGLVVGTVGYMSPEQVRGLAVDARSDLFSFGAVLYELLSGRRAFAGETPADTMSAILREEPPELSRGVADLPAGLERIVTRCLEKQPAARFQSAHDLAFALEALVGGSSGSGLRAAPVAPAAARRPRWGPALGVAALLVGLALASYLVGRGGAGADSGALAFKQKTFGQQSIFQARFAPDGQTVVFSATRGGNSPELFVLRPDSPEPHALGLPATHLLSVSSKGELAVLTGARYLAHHRLFEGTLARMPIEGGAPRSLTAGVREADWAPDGDGLAIVRAVGGRDRLEYPIGRVLYESSGYLSDPRFSPDGRRIGFMEHPFRWDDRGTVNVVDLSGKNKVLAGVFWGEEGLAWSRDGREVLFSASISGEPPNPYAVNLAGRRRAFMRAPGALTIFDTGPKGRWLVSREDQTVGLSARPPGQDGERDLSWVDSGMGPRLSGDGRMLLFTDQGEAAGSNYNACVRGTDGSPIVRLGEGSGDDLSRDGTSVLSVVASDPPRLMLYPTGTGDPVRVDHGQLARMSQARWFTDGRRILLNGSEAGKAPREYVVELHGGALRPVTPPGAVAGAPSPDGRWVVALTPEGWTLFSIEGGVRPRRLGALSPEDDVIRWTPDGRGVLVFRRAGFPLQVDRVDVASGARAHFAEVAPQQAAGLVSYLGVSFADDLRSYAYCYQRYFSTLFQVDRSR
jgi:eukaryotic-like serine/threonine-protein kinase